MRRFAIFACLIVPVPGCGSGIPPVDHPPTAQCTGVVSYHGDPVDGALVLLLSDESNSTRWTPSGTTDAEGRFEIRTVFSRSQIERGLIPGSYKVLVSKAPVADELPLTPHEAHLAEVEALNAGQTAGQNAGKRRATNDAPEFRGLLPEKYASEKTTPLSLEVSYENTSVAFELED